MMHVKYGICPKPSLVQAEDIVGYNNNFYWLLDGATPPVGDLNHEKTRNFVQKTNDLLRFHSENATDTRSLLKKVLSELIALSDHSDHGYSPYSTIILVHVTGGVVEYSLLADSTLGICINGRTSIISDERLKGVAAHERDEVRNLVASGTNEDSALYTTARKKLIEAELCQQNVDGGYWIFKPDMSILDQMICGSIHFDTSDDVMIILLSDGLERLVSKFGKYDDVCKLGYALLSCEDQKIFSELREEELKCSKAVSSLHDDASYILITNAAGGSGL